MGGEAIVNEGKMTADSIVVKSIKLRNVNDGVLFATVFMLDDDSILLGLGKASISKDVVAPRSTQLKTNLTGYGNSNIDQFIVDVKVTDRKGIFLLKARSESTGDSVGMQLSFSDSSIRVTDLKLKSLPDGVISIEFTPVDTAGNIGEVSRTTVYKDTKDPEVTLSKISISGLKGIFSVQANEYISNTLQSSSIVLDNGTLDSVVQKSSRLFYIYVNRVCKDTVYLRLTDSALKDTVGNTNKAVAISEIDVVVPVKPTITNAAGMFNVPATYATYQWLKDGNEVLGATRNEYKPGESGSYSVRVSSAAGCEIVSDTIPYVVTSLTNVNLQAHGVRMYPNPAREYFLVVLQRDLLKPMKVEVIDLYGRIRLVKMLSQKQTVIDVSGLSAGVYFVRFDGIGGTVKILIE
jgi:hypothetical protein